MYSDTKCVIKSLNMDKRRQIKRAELETFGNSSYVHCTDCDHDHGCIHMLALIKLYPLNICSLLYVIYTSIKITKMNDVIPIHLLKRLKCKQM